MENKMTEEQFNMLKHHLELEGEINQLRLKDQKDIIKYRNLDLLLRVWMAAFLAIETSLLAAVLYVLLVR